MRRGGDKEKAGKPESRKTRRREDKDDEWISREMKMTYFDKEDVLYLEISDESEAGSIELGPNITAELNDKGELIGVEILRASDFIRDSVLESIQAKMLQLDIAKSAQ